MKKFAAVLLCVLMLCLTSCAKIEILFVFEDDTSSAPVIAQTEAPTAPPTETSTDTPATAPNVNTGSLQNEEPAQ